MKVSAIVPCFNHARFLPQRLASVFAQTHAELEVILLDDASTDESADVLRAYAQHPRVRACVCNTRNSGSPFAQWNAGAALATGEALWYAESDDDCSPQLVSTLATLLQAHPQVSVAFAHSVIMDADGHCSDRLHRRYYPELSPGRWHYDFVASGFEERTKYLWQKNTLPNASAVLIRREHFDRVGGAPSGMRLCGDWLLWTRLLEHGDLAFCAQPLNRFRTHKHTLRNKLPRNVRLHETLVPILRILSTCQFDAASRERVLRRIARYWWWLLLSGQVNMRGHTQALRMLDAHQPGFARLLARCLPEALWRGAWHVWRGVIRDDAPF